MTTCESTHIASYGYDEKTWVLSIVLRNTPTEVRHYAEFPPETFDDFEHAKSKGQFFNQHIANQYMVSKSPAIPEHIANEPAPPVSIYEPAARMAAPEQQVTPEPSAILAAEPEKITPERAISIIAPQNPKVDKLTLEATRMASLELQVNDNDSYVAVTEHVAKLTGVRKAIFEIIDPYREIAYRTYDQIQKLNKSRLDPIDAALKRDKYKLTAYEQEMEAKRLEAQRKAEEEAARIAEEERKRRSEEMTLAAVDDALAAGDTVQAESLFDNPIEAPPMPTYVPPIMYDPPAVRGSSTRKNWKGEVTNIEELILDVAKGIEHFRKHGHLGPHAPATFLTANPTAINQEAKSKEKMFNYPGVRAWNDAVKTVKGR